MKITFLVGETPAVGPILAEIQTCPYIYGNMILVNIGFGLKIIDSMLVVVITVHLCMYS